MATLVESAVGLYVLSICIDGGYHFVSVHNAVTGEVVYTTDIMNITAAEWLFKTMEVACEHVRTDIIIKQLMIALYSSYSK